MAVTQWALPEAQHVLPNDPQGSASRWQWEHSGLRKPCKCPGSHKMSVPLARKLQDQGRGAQGSDRLIQVALR